MMRNFRKLLKESKKKKKKKENFFLMFSKENFILHQKEDKCNNIQAAEYAFL